VKIGPHLIKLLSNIKGLGFLGHGVYTVSQKVYPLRLIKTLANVDRLSKFVIAKRLQPGIM